MFKTAKSRSITAFAILLNLANFAYAQDATPKPDWDVRIGAGVSRIPNYEGSEDHSLVPFPYLRIRWKDFITLGSTGVDVELVEEGEFDAGIGLGFDPGRNEDGKSVLGNTNDDTLVGLGDIDLAPGARAYFEYDFKYVDIGASVIRYFGNDNKGLVVDMTLDKGITLTEKWRIVPAIKATWVDTEYMQTYFGVTAGQSARSQFAPFQANQGFKDVSLNLNIMYSLNENWFVFVNGQLKKMLNDAKDSPISRDDTNTLIASGLGYMF